MSYYVVMHNLATGKLPVNSQGGFSRVDPYSFFNYKDAVTTAGAHCERHKSAFCVEDATGRILKTLYPKNRALATIPPTVKAPSKSGLRKLFWGDF